jgi:two-component system, OmpR family, phosphate regulon sensor histidine kinase PhoR
MRLTERLLVGSLAVVGLLIVAVVAIAGGRLRARLLDEQLDDLRRETHYVAGQWRPGVNVDSLADIAGRMLRRRVTLVDSTGRVIGDSEFAPEELARLENHSSRPEIVAARRAGEGNASRLSASAGDEELYVAVRAGYGFARVSVPTRQVQAAIAGAQRDVLVAGAIGLIGALLLAWLFARSVSAPVVELRDVARAIAAGDLAARPALSAPGEIGDLAAALHRMAEQLATRLHALKEDEELMTTIVESLHQGIVALSERGQVVRVNAHSRRLLGVAATVPFAAELLPRHPALRHAIDDALAGRGTDFTELELGERTLGLTARPLRGGGAVLSVLDLTELRRLEMVRRDFVANVSHELKTPLTVVSGFAETLEDDDLAPEQRRRFVEAIQSNAHRMQRIVDDLLDLSRIEGGHWTPNKERVDLGAVVADTFTSVAVEADRREVRLSSRLEAPTAYADPTALRQIVGNLVENAVRYTAIGDVTVTSEFTEGSVRIRVRDTGIGIPSEHLSRIFERFYRVDPARSRADGGTGLGLAIVRHLVEAHDGRVSAESEPGHGTTISVWLPEEV